jgi:hypothetical protein
VGEGEGVEFCAEVEFYNPAIDRAVAAAEELRRARAVAAGLPEGVEQEGAARAG